MNEGFIYVLVNSSMPDLVKVGLTTRKPSDRASELSGVTGVPTPFIVVYETEVNDCVDAEKFVHEMLSIKGYRVSDAREFFRAPVQDVIKVIMQLPPSLTDSVDSIILPSDEKLINDDVFDELSSLTLSQKATLENQPWYQIYTDAESAYYGADENLVDYSKALKLYTSAAKLGCNLAYHRIGEMYLYGTGPKMNSEKSLEFLKESARLNNYVSYVVMAYAFAYDDNLSNARKCMSLFFRDREKYKSDILEEELRLFIEILSLIRYFPEIFAQDSVDLLNNLRKIKTELNETCLALVERYSMDDESEDHFEAYSLMLKFLQSI